MLPDERPFVGGLVPVLRRQPVLQHAVCRHIRLQRMAASRNVVCLTSSTEADNITGGLPLFSTTAGISSGDTSTVCGLALLPESSFALTSTGTFCPGEPWIKRDRLGLPVWEPTSHARLCFIFANIWHTPHPLSKGGMPVPGGFDCGVDVFKPRPRPRPAWQPAGFEESPLPPMPSTGKNIKGKKYYRPCRKGMGRCVSFLI